MSKKSISSPLLILTTRKLSSAPRVIREIEALKDYQIFVCGTQPPTRNSNVTFFNVSSIRQSSLERVVNIIFKILRIYPPVIKVISRRFYDLEKIVADLKPRVVITHEPHFLPYLAELRSIYKYKLLYNAHEYHPLERNTLFWIIWWKPYFENVYKRCLPSVDLFINVCDSIAHKCREKFNKDSLVIPNTSRYHDLSPTPIGKIVRIIHHGGCYKDRKIECMIETARLLGSGYALDLMLTSGDDDYFKYIKILASQTDNVKIIPPVEFDDIVSFTNAYDVGLYMLAPTSYNNAVALPNKFFEFIQARLCLAVGPNPEMKNYMEKYNLGVVSLDFTPQSMSNSIRMLSPDDLFICKQNADTVAREVNAEFYNTVLTDAIETS